MNYQRIYNELINNRKTNPHNKSTYTEKHHIVPKSHGGSNSKDNLVHLSAREHFIAHWLLWRIHRDSKMACAFNSMRMNSGGNRYKNSYGFEEAKRCKIAHQSGSNNHYFGKSRSDEYKLKMSIASSGSRNPRYGVKVSDETRAKISSAKKGIPHKLNVVTCPHCNKSGASNNMTRWHFGNCSSL